MPKGTCKSADAEGLDHLYHAFKRIHRIADENAPADASMEQRLRAGINSLFAPPHREATGRPHATRAQAAVAAVTTRFAAGMIATFGGKSMIDSLGRAVRLAEHKRRGGKFAK